MRALSLGSKKEAANERAAVVNNTSVIEYVECLRKKKLIGAMKINEQMEGKLVLIHQEK